jgi:large conductance mechanosensitive channel
VARRGDDAALNEREELVFKDFKDFLLKQNALALAVGVIIGAAVGKVVSSIVENVLNPIIGLLLPSGSWRTAAWVLKEHVDPKTGQTVIDAAISYGQLIGALIDFLIIAFVLYLITKSMLPKPVPTKECPQCKETIPAAATRCKACTQQVA